MNDTDKTPPIELVHFFSDVSSGGNSSAIRGYRQMMYEYTNVENNQYVFDIDKLKKAGYPIPPHIKEMKLHIENTDWAAFQLGRLGVDVFHYLVNNFIDLNS